MSTDDTWITILIGRNGLGKSRLLGDIARTFLSLEAVGNKRKTTISAGSSELLVSSNGVLEYLGTESFHGLVGQGDERATTMPARVIALTGTPFDKFPLPLRRNENDGEGSNLYAYRGLRDHLGRVSSTAALFRALDGLFDASEQEAYRRQRIGEVFAFLGYSPWIRVDYRWTARGRQMLWRPDEGYEVPNVPTSSRDYVARMQHESPELYLELRDLARRVEAEEEHSNTVGVIADFNGPFGGKRRNFTERQALRRAGLLAIRNVVLQKAESEVSVSIDGVSSGELALVTSLLGLASVIEDNSLILIDEPEIGLHPEWQSKYVALLTDTFRAYEGCHIIIATHSPVILSDIDPQRSNVFSLERSRRVAEDADIYSGKSADFLLMQAFDVAGNDNLYLKQLLVEALRLAADGEVRSERFAAVIGQLRRVVDTVDEESPTRMIIEQLLAVDREGRR
ncbi:AAA family ATPase [Clavibacter michiganensis]|uniref:AAA family ATPase n=1 Tax=Clavibacter michiganensis TaxID=28447 RepID=UPI00292CB79F|nr:AAA family ATPase [Clavibacter michiganensis]